MAAPLDADSDVLIVGAGPTGLALACALAQAGFRSQVLEQAPAAALQDPLPDGRDIALTHRSREILSQLGLWQAIDPDEIAPIRGAKVSNAHSPAVLPFLASDQGQEALGWLVPNHCIRRAAYTVAQSHASHIRIHTEAQVNGLLCDADVATLSLSDGRRLRAPLVVAADSRFSNLRRMAGIGARSVDFGRTVIVCRLSHQADLQATVHECFLPGHTLALLPMNRGQASVVWTVSNDQAQALMQQSDAAFAAGVQQAWTAELGPDLGEVQVLGQRHSYPLVAVYADRFWAERVVLVGDAAVGMHPVTAHGYNFGLYGVQTLIQALLGAQARGQQLGDAHALQTYARQHRRQTWPIYTGTNAIVKLFTNEHPMALLARQGVMQLARRLSPLRAFITRQLTGRQ